MDYKLTPKEQAIELINEYYDIHELFGFFREKYLAKQCATLAVNKILIAVESDWGFMQQRTEYWTEVKEEIKNL